MARRPLVVDALALLLMAAGATLVIVTGDPVWTSLAAVGAAASVSPACEAGGWRGPLRRGDRLDRRPGVRRPRRPPLGGARHDGVGWAALALTIGAALAVTAARRATADRQEVARALEFAHDATVHDPLTDLSNRRGLDLLGAQILESARRRGDAVYCVFLDVDGLGRVHGRLGQSGVDEVLLTVATRCAAPPARPTRSPAGETASSSCSGPGRVWRPRRWSGASARSAASTRPSTATSGTPGSAPAAPCSSRGTTAPSSPCSARPTARCTCGGRCAARRGARRTDRTRLEPSPHASAAAPAEPSSVCRRGQRGRGTVARHR